jgi:hypothetical protein
MLGGGPGRKATLLVQSSRVNGSILQERSKMGVWNRRQASFETVLVQSKSSHRSDIIKKFASFRYH